MRAISILLVLLLHTHNTYVDNPVQESPYLEYLGHLGVFVFFVISGLLITWLMIRERDATGAFSLRNFYIRRFLRILPVFWLLILTVSALKITHVISIEWLDILRALTFTHNYPLTLSRPEDYAVWLAHTWSLSLEEQFYLVWPGLFALLPKKLSPRLAIILAVSGPILRTANYFLLPSLRGLDTFGFESRIDILMAGCAAAFLLDSPAWCDRIRKIPAYPTLAATSTILLIADPILIGHFRPHSIPAVIVSLFVPTMEAVAIALTLLVVVAGKPGLPFKLLNARVPTHIGKLSYSLYIWQQLFLPRDIAASIFSLLCRLAAAYLVALFSFRFIERPLLKLRSRFRQGVAV